MIAHIRHVVICYLSVQKKAEGAMDHGNLALFSCFGSWHFGWCVCAAVPDPQSLSQTVCFGTLIVHTRCQHSMKSWVCPVILTTQLWRKPWRRRLWNTIRTSIRLRSSKCGRRNSSISNSSWRRLRLNKVVVCTTKSIFARSGPTVSWSWWIWMEACSASSARMEAMATQQILGFCLTS